MPEHNTMDLWNEVRHTDPKYAEPVDLRGGFTSINPMYQQETATRLWGPYGDSWGIKNLRWFTDASIGYIQLTATFFYPDETTGSPVEFEYTVDDKWRPGSEQAKGMQTSLRSKCLSLLGFNADVYKGQYDDVDYVREMQAKFADDEGTWIGEQRHRIKQCKTGDQLDVCRKRVETMHNHGSISPDAAAALMDEINTRDSELGVSQ